jgi:hypothetical protein
VERSKELPLEYYGGPLDGNTDPLVDTHDAGYPEGIVYNMGSNEIAIYVLTSLEPPTYTFKNIEQYDE